MKNLILSVCLFMAACSNAGNSLSNADALTLLQKNKVVDAYYFTDLSTADENVARKPQMDTLEKAGLIVVNRHPTLYDIGKPLIRLTAAGKKDSLPSTAADTTERRLKVAAMHIKEVTKVEQVTDNGQNFADVHFIVQYDSITPFHILEKGDFNKPATRIKRFAFAGGKWTLVDN